MHFAGREKNTVGEAAVAHDAEGLVVFAAIGEAAAAGVAFLAVEVRFDGAAVTRADMAYVFTDGNNLDAEFVSWDPGVGEEGHFAEVAAEVGATDPHAVDADEDFVGSGRGGFGDVDEFEVFGFGELDRFHWGLLKVGQCVEGYPAHEWGLGNRAI